jgi:alkanesulfonate monooxygenase SsuD/methylene tetrahydromethanopterin reductase-like flavin-dependent oxidoreductase (luciferase family)
VPIWVGALGERTTRVAAQLGDGWVPAFMTRDDLPARTARLNRLRETAAPEAQPLTVASGPITAAGEDTDAARGIVATCLAWYLGAMGDIYRRSVSAQGYAAEVRAILSANPRPSPRRGVVPPDAELLLDQLAAYGTSDQINQQLTSWDEAADIVTLLLPPGLPWPVIHSTLLAAAPRLAERETGSASLATAAHATR